MRYIGANKGIEMKTRIKEFDGGFIPEVKRFMCGWRGLSATCDYAYRNAENQADYCRHVTKESAQKTLDKYIAMQDLTK